MKLLSVRIAATTVTLLFAVHLYAQNPNNPIQVARLRWYQANTAAQFSTCLSPVGLAFDGAHMWVGCANGTPAAIQEFNVGDGALVRTTTLSSSPDYVLYAPWGVAFDGANIWVGYGQVSHFPAAGVYKL